LIASTVAVRKLRAGFQSRLPACGQGVTRSATSLPDTTVFCETQIKDQ
jgi:hypothetical protein